MARRRRFRSARRTPDLLGPRSARWSRQPTLGPLAAVLIALAAVVGGLIAVARVFASAPSIAPSVPDSEQQSGFPFTVSNNGWLSLYGVHLRCGVTAITLGDGANTLFRVLQVQARWGIFLGTTRASSYVPSTCRASEGRTCGWRGRGSFTSWA